MTGGDGTRLLAGETFGMAVRRLALDRSLVEIGGIDQIRRYADPRQQVEAARRGGGKNEFGPGTV